MSTDKDNKTDKNINYPSVQIETANNVYVDGNDNRESNTEELASNIHLLKETAEKMATSETSRNLIKAIEKLEKENEDAEKKIKIDADRSLWKTLASKLDLSSLEEQNEIDTAETSEGRDTTVNTERILEASSVACKDIRDKFNKVKKEKAELKAKNEKLKKEIEELKGKQECQINEALLVEQVAVNVANNFLNMEENQFVKKILTFLTHENNRVLINKLQSKNDNTAIEELIKNVENFDFST